MSPEPKVGNWRAIEALRAGVPNRDAVRALGSSQLAIEERFKAQLATLKDRFGEGLACEGMLIAGDFGTGKSHLLEYLQHVAVESNFVCSKVVISKETPLYDPARVFNAAIEAAIAPGHSDTALVAIATKLSFQRGFDTPEYARFFQWVNRPDNSLSPRFAATVFVFERGGGINNAEVADKIIRFWSGDRMSVRELRAWLRELGEVATYSFDRVSEKDLALQRYRFIPQLMVAAGYAGWVILVDEVELIGRYSVRQRGRSYAEIARHLGRLEASGIPGLTSVLSISTEFESVVLDERRDDETVPNRLRVSARDEDLLLASQAERGIRAIRREKVRLNGPTEAVLREIADKVRAVYKQAYEWEASTDYQLDRTLTIRQQIKRLINEWDLRRQYPDYEPVIGVEELREDYREDLELEQPTAEEPVDGGSAGSGTAT